MNAYRIFKTGIALIALSSFGSTAHAHHSYGPYQIGTEIQFQGEVTKVGLANPHSWIYVEAENENGERESWALEGAGINSFRNSGWDGVAIGDTVGVTCVPLRSRDTGCYIRDIQIVSTSRVAGGSNTAAVVESSWERFSYPDQNYRANFPHEPTITKKPYLSEYGGTFSSTIYEASEGESSYSVTVVDFSDAKEVYEAMTDQINVPGPHNFWLYTQMGAINYAARQFRLRGGDVIYDAWHGIDFIEGNKLSIINEDNTRTYAGIYRHADRLFVLEANLPEGSASAAGFLESLHILDDEGERVRYILQPDHSRVRIDIEAENRAREENGGEVGLDRSELIL
jgi:hypothetical protein